MGDTKQRMPKLSDIDLQIFSPLHKLKKLLYHNDSVSPSQSSIRKGGIIQDFINIQAGVYFVKNYRESITIVLWLCQSHKDLHFLLKQAQFFWCRLFCCFSNIFHNFYMQVGIRSSDGTRVFKKVFCHIPELWRFMLIDLQGLVKQRMPPGSGIRHLECVKKGLEASELTITVIAGCKDHCCYCYCCPTEGNAWS